jgi:hypothetical protein
VNVDGLDMVAEVLRETAEPLPDGERRTLLLGLADIFEEAAGRLDGQAAGVVLIEDAPPPTPVEAPAVPQVDDSVAPGAW